MPGWTDHVNQVERDVKELLEASEPIAIAKCPDCGWSMYLVDHDDNNICDRCWDTLKKLSFDESEERQRRIARGGL